MLTEKMKLCMVSDKLKYSNFEEIVGFLNLILSGIRNEGSLAF
jgi:hypothetical protein